MKTILIRFVSFLFLIALAESSFCHAQSHYIDENQEFTILEAELEDEASVIDEWDDPEFFSLPELAYPHIYTFEESTSSICTRSFDRHGPPPDQISL